MVVERDIVGALEARGVGVVRSTVVVEYRASFGDMVVDVDSSLGRLRLTSDRGQLYVDVLAADGQLIDGETVWPSLLELYASRKWSIDDLVWVLVESKRVAIDPVLGRPL